MSETASHFIGQLTAGFADELEETMDSEAGEQAFAAMVCVWTTHGVRWRTSTPPHSASTAGVLKLLQELARAVGETEMRKVAGGGPRCH